MKLTLLFLLITVVFWMPQSVLSQEGLEQLVNRMPPSANAVMVADIASIRDSEIARTEKWFESHSARIESGVAFLPQGSDRVIFASQIDFASFTPIWTSGFMTFQHAPLLSQVGLRDSGTMDSVAQQDVLRTASNRFVFRPSQNMLGTYSPANRQNLANWLSHLSAGKNNAVAPYLLNSFDSPGSQFTMAFDVANTVSASDVHQQAKDSEALSRARINPRKFSELLASLRGVSINVAFDSKITAEIAIEFGENAALIRPVAKQLLLEFTDNHGAHIADLAGWSVDVEGNRVLTSGTLSKKSLRRLISLFDTPEPHLSGAQANSTAVPSPGEASKQYFDALKSMISELEKDIGQASLSTYLYQKWMKSYADEIDNLSMHGVDPDMLDFGAGVARSFRQISLRISHGHQDVSVKNKDLMAYSARNDRNRDFGWGGWGYPNAYRRRTVATDTQTERMANNQRARSKSITFGADLFTEIRDQESQVRRLMVQRYPDQF